MASLLRTSVARTLWVSIAGGTKTAGLWTSTRRFIADNKKHASPAREHGPHSVVEAGSMGKMCLTQHGKEVNAGKTQRDAIDSAMGVLDKLARDVAGSDGVGGSDGVVGAWLGGCGGGAGISTPSSPGLAAVHDTASGPIYSVDTLPPKSDATLEFVTNLLMKDGKKAQAQRFTTRTLWIISTITNSNPLRLVHDAIWRTAPLVKMQSKKRGGKTLQVPVALTPRQSTRKALMWIIDASKRRPDRELEKRLAAEFLAVVEGTSSAIAKKEEQHRVAMVNRANAAVRI